MIRDLLGWLVVAKALVFPQDFGPVSLGVSARAQCAPEIRTRPQTTWPGLTHAGTVLLPNGWSLKPAGRQTRLGDFPVQMAVHPSEPVLAILHAGYGEHEVVTASTETGKIIGRVALPETFAGLVWSADGKQLFVGGGFDDRIYRFDHAGGLLSNKTTFPHPDPEKSLKVPGGLALSADGKTLWVANVYGHSLGRLDTTAGTIRDLIPLAADSYPYGLAWDESRKRLYVSLWNHASVAVIDTETLKVAGSLPTQEHPNELLLARGGKVLYVANANRNSVSVIDTVAAKAIETIGTAIDPALPRAAPPAHWRSRPTNRSCWSPMPTPTTSPWSTSRNPGPARRSVSFPPAGIPPRCGSPVTARRSTWPMARARARGPIAMGPTPWTRRGKAGRFASISRGSSRELCRSF